MGRREAIAGQRVATIGAARSRETSPGRAMDVEVVDLVEVEDDDGEVDLSEAAHGLCDEVAEDDDDVVELTDAEAYSASREMRREQFVQAPMPGHYFYRKVDAKDVTFASKGYGKAQIAASASYGSTPAVVGPKFTKSVQMEIHAMSKSRGALPLNASSAVLLAVDPERLDLMRAVFLPHEDTPYSGGAFAIDFKLMPEYPDKPPLARLLTTGNGKVRFNPNLYASGKVCLSLLGTWSGPGWKPGTSTMLQVLVSIQALIFNAEPYYNEPGFERYAGKCGTAKEFLEFRKSRAYTMRVRLDTVNHALLPALARPINPVLAPFEKFLDGHYTRRAAFIEDQLLNWLGEYAEHMQDEAYEKGAHSPDASVEIMMDAVQAARTALAPFKEAGRKLRAPPPVINLLDDDDADDKGKDKDDRGKRPLAYGGEESTPPSNTKRPRAAPGDGGGGDGSGGAPVDGFGVS